MMSERGYLDGSRMANVFNMMRPRDMLLAPTSRCVPSPLGGVFHNAGRRVVPTMCGDAIDVLRGLAKPEETKR